jgi:hypothetical protein
MIFLKSSTAGADQVRFDQQTASSTATITSVSAVSPAQMGSPHSAKRSGESASKKIENAVYAHIRAVRALGRTQINTDEIAKALGLTVAEVNNTIASLRARGVKLG